MNTDVHAGFSPEHNADVVMAALEADDIAARQLNDFYAYA